MIGIGRPHGGEVLPEWMLAFEELIKPTDERGRPDWTTFATMRVPVHLARNKIVRSVLHADPECSHLFFIDDDICLPANGLMQLLQDSVEHDLPIVSGLYIHRGEPHLPIAFRRTPDGRYLHLTKIVAGLQEVDACGAGCLLIRRDVLEAIEATGDEWFDWSLKVSEDMAFCMRAKALGYPIVLDANVQAEHLSVIRIPYRLFEDRKAHGAMNYNVAPEDTQYCEDVRPWIDSQPECPESASLPRRRHRRRH